MTPLSPTLWQTLTRYFGLHASAATQWWEALQQAKSPKAHTWLEQMLFYDARPTWNQAPEAQQRFIVHSMPPVQVVEAIESLVDEGLLTRTRGTALQEAVLECVSSTGQWKT
jgi:hypothetical protein